MKIQNRTTSGPSGAQSGGPGEIQKAGQSSSGTASASGPAEGDRIELSSMLGRLSEAISTYANSRAERVQALMNEYEAGRFQPNSQATSRALITAALSPAA
jgi:hypothetical protein